MIQNKIVEQWFNQWEKGNFYDLPITESFKHVSPYGIIEGKLNYEELVNANKDKFLGYRFIILDGFHEKNKACVRYTAIQGDFKLEVSEWYYFNDQLIDEIVSYYHIEGQISEGRKISYPE